MREIQQEQKPPPRYFYLVTGLFLLVLFLFCIGLYLSLEIGETAPRVQGVYLANLNGDDHLDAFAVFLNEAHKVFLNDGHGQLAIGDQPFMRNYILALGDINGDGQVDAILSQFAENKNLLACKTNSNGLVLDNPLGSVSSQAFATRDSDQDGIPDFYVAACCRKNSTLVSYGEFADGSPCLGTTSARAVALADLNSDGALDAFLAKGWVVVDGKTQKETSNEVWFNNGHGDFYDSGQRLGEAESFSVVLGDLNGDGLTDAVVGNRGPDDVLFNDGSGRFSYSGQRLGVGSTLAVNLADLDGDGDLDLFASGESSARIWLNDGTGHFQNGQLIRFNRTSAVTIGDVTGDRIVDVLVVGVDYYQVWRGNGAGRFTADPRTSY